MLFTFTYMEGIFNCQSHIKPYSRAVEYCFFFVFFFGGQINALVSLTFFVNIDYLSLTELQRLKRKKEKQKEGKKERNR